MSEKSFFELEEGATSRRRFITITSAAGVSALAGCNSSEESSEAGSQSSGDERSIESQFREDWPVETKGQSVNDEAVQFEYTAVEGQSVSSVTTHFAQSETPWMREFALTVQESFNDIGVPVELVNVQPSTRYGEFWRADVGHPVEVVMNLHGPDPQRGLDPNPFIMRAHPETGGNYINYKNDEITELLNEQSQTLGDPQQRAEICQDIQQKLSEDVYLIAANFPEVITVANTTNWEGYVPTPGNGTTRDSFVWTQVNLQPKGDSTTWVKGVTAGMQGTNLPWSTGGLEEKRLLNVYDGLYDASPQLEIVPGLATDHEVIDDTTIEMDLREGVTWHDGESFGPDDVKFSVEKYKQTTAPQQGPFYRTIDSVEVVSTSGGGRVRFSLTEPDASFLTQRAVRSAIIPKHRWEDIDAPAQYNPDNPVGTGPFQFNNWSQGEELRLSKYEDHWLWGDEIRKEYIGEEYFTPGDGINEMVHTNVGNVSTLIGAMQSGDIDAIGTTVSNQQADRASQSQGVEKQRSRNFAPTDVHLNHIVPLFRDKTFRVALSHAVDKQSFVDNTLGGRGEVIKGQNLITPLLQPYYGEAEPYEYDPDRARTMLQQAGYTFNSDDMLVWPEGDAWNALTERVEDGHASRSDIDQPDFS